jgi:hypothetical protein
VFCSLVLWSDDLSTWTWPSSTVTVTSENSCKLTIFPFTVIIPSLTSTVTPAGITTGFYLFLTSYSLFISIRNKYFTTYIQLFCFLSSHQTFDVETIAMPNPLRILGMVEELEYLRKPGLLILWYLITDS